MMLDKRVNFFLCVVLVTCTSPLYRRAGELEIEGLVVDELDTDKVIDSDEIMDSDELDQRIAAFHHAIQSPPWLESERTHDRHQGLPAEVYDERLDAPGKVDAGHLGQSSQSSHMAFLRDIDTTQNKIPQWNGNGKKFVADVARHFSSHLTNCAVNQGVRNYIKNVNACVCHTKHELIVRLRYTNEYKILTINELKTPVRLLFKEFHIALTSLPSTGLLDTPRYNVVEINAAIKWLWNVLTKHEVHEDRYSLPVIGILNRGTKEEHFKWGPLQMSLMNYLTEKNHKPEKAAGKLALEPEEPAAKLALELAQSYHRLHGRP